MPVRHDPAQFFDRRRRWRGAMTLGRPLSDLRRVSLKLSPPSRIRHYFSYRSYCIVSAVRPMNTRIIRVFRYLAFRRLRTENRSVDSSILSLATNLRLLALHTAQASDGKPRRESATPRCPEWSRVPSLPHCLRRPDIYTRRPTSYPFRFSSIRHQCSGQPPTVVFPRELLRTSRPMSSPNFATLSRRSAPLCTAVARPAISASSHVGDDVLFDRSTTSGIRIDRPARGEAICSQPRATRGRILSIECGDQWRCRVT